MTRIVLLIMIVIGCYLVAVGQSDQFISMSPAPVTGNIIKFHVKDNNKDLSVTISDFQGRALISRQYKALSYKPDLELPTPYLTAGAYIITFEASGYKEAKQIQISGDE